MGIENELKKGSIQTLILAVLSTGALHGYGIAREIEKRSADVLSFNEGALYPALRSLERDELVTSEWYTQDRGPARRVYQLTAEGIKRLAEHTADWTKFVAGMGAVISGVSLKSNDAITTQLSLSFIFSLPRNTFNPHKGLV